MLLRGEGVGEEEREDREYAASSAAGAGDRAADGGGVVEWKGEAPVGSAAVRGVKCRSEGESRELAPDAPRGVCVCCGDCRRVGSCPPKSSSSVAAVLLRAGTACCERADESEEVRPVLDIDLPLPTCRMAGMMMSLLVNPVEYCSCPRVMGTGLFLFSGTNWGDDVFACPGSCCCCVGSGCACCRCCS